MQVHGSDPNRQRKKRELYTWGNVKRHTMERLESFVSGTRGKRLTYKALIQ